MLNPRENPNDRLLVCKIILKVKFYLLLNANKFTFLIVSKTFDYSIILSSILNVLLFSAPICLTLHDLYPFIKYGLIEYRRSFSVREIWRRSVGCQYPCYAIDPRWIYQSHRLVLYHSLWGPSLTFCWTMSKLNRWTPLKTIYRVTFLIGKRKRYQEALKIRHQIMLLFRDPLYHHLQLQSLVDLAPTPM